MSRFRLVTLSLVALILMAAFLVACSTGPKVHPGPKNAEVCEGPPQPAPEPEPEPEPAPQVDMQAVAREAALERIRTERIYFAFDSDRILPESEKNLEEIAGLLKEYQDISLEIQGHCDERGSVDYNMELALRRAEAAKRFLVKEGVPEERLSASALGKADPLMAGHSENAWAKNRRCEFIIK
ncbi:MAG: OmpA family protein [Thermodesulfobacteriota bacterium]